MLHLILHPKDSRKLYAGTDWDGVYTWHWLVHRSLYRPADEADLKAAGGFSARLQRLSSEAAAMTEQLQKLILAKFRRAGMTQADFERKAKSVTQQWLAP